MAATSTAQLLKGLPNLPPAFNTAAGSALRAGMRKLWADHVFWTRDYVVNVVAESPGANDRPTT